MPTFTRLIRLLLYGLPFHGMIIMYSPEYASGENGVLYPLPSIITVFQGHRPYSESTQGLEICLFLLPLSQSSTGTVLLVFSH